jgi:tryptophan synthase alpha chain
MVAQLRLRGVAQPLVLMSYFNPILAAGVDNFIQAACQAGADGFIIPDLPPEEAGIMEAACQARQVALVYLAAPTSPPGRLASLAARTTGFLYLVSLTGVTGARAELQEGLEAFIQRARAQTRSPLAVGFGLSTPAQARTVGALADGVIVGSALIKAVEEAQNPGAAAGEFIHRFRLALEPERHTKM